MSKDLAVQITELQQVHTGLTQVSADGNKTILKGPLCFEASAKDLDPITECFEIEIVIPETYPEDLPRVRETGGKIGADYDHVYESGTLCLAVPIEERRVFLEQPSLLGYVNRLVVPYFYGFCHWKTHDVHPFDESEHGPEGIVHHYMDLLGLTDELTVLAVIAFLYEHGYRGHHSCPCGSEDKVRNCHGKALRELHEQHTDVTLKTDFLVALDVCMPAIKSNGTEVSMPLLRQVSRLIDRIKD